jgi:hypothetical protein
VIQYAAASRFHYRSEGNRCRGRHGGVRLVWTLTTRVKATGKVGTTEEQGLDVFGKGSDGRWRIIRFMTYERP